MASSNDPILDAPSLLILAMTFGSFITEAWLSVFENTIFGVQISSFSCSVKVFRSESCFCVGLVRGHLLQVVPELASGFAQRVAWLLRLVSGVTQRDGRQPGL